MDFRPTIEQEHKWGYLGKGWGEGGGEKSWTGQIQKKYY